MTEHEDDMPAADMGEPEEQGPGEMPAGEMPQPADEEGGEG